MSSAGELFVVGTPIGNLADLTLRAKETLQHVELVLAEDTRRTRQLLSHLGIANTPLACVDAHATEQELLRFTERVKAGAKLALVTDAGMPSVSDPGARLVALCRAHSLQVTVVPGPSAVTAAVAASGLADDGFWFLGFLPRKGNERELALQRIAEFEQAVVLFESPKRTARTLRDLGEVLGTRPVCVARELTKRFEEVLVLPAASWGSAPREWLGEVTLVIAPRGRPDGAVPHDEELDVLIRRRLDSGQSPRTISEELSGLVRRSRRDLYQRALELKAPE